MGQEETDTQGGTWETVTKDLAWRSLSFKAILITSNWLSIVLLFTGALNAIYGQTERIEAIIWLFALGGIGPFALSAAKVLKMWKASDELGTAFLPLFVLGIGLSLYLTRFSSINGSVHFLSVTCLAGTFLGLRYVSQYQEARVMEPTGRIPNLLKASGPIVVLAGIAFVLASFWPVVMSPRFLTSLALIFASAVSTSLALLSSKTAFLLRRIIVPLASLPSALLAWDLRYIPDLHHLSFFLAPAYEVSNGRLMLVETFSQYGVGVFYFLSAFLSLLGFGYGSLAFVSGGLSTVTCLVIYAVIYSQTRSVRWATGGSLIATLVGPIASMGTVAMVPSTGFLRFGPTWLLILFVSLSLRDGTTKRRLAVVVALMLGISVLWSFESAFYSAGVYFGSLVLLPIIASQRRLALVNLTRGITAIAVVVGFGYLLTLWRSSGQILPSIYFSYIRLYSTEGFGTLLVNSWSPGLLLVALGLLILVWILICVVGMKSRRMCDLSDLTTLTAVTIYALLAFTYFLGRSHPNNLTHIAAPFVVAVVLWSWKLNPVLRPRLESGVSVRYYFRQVWLIGLALSVAVSLNIGSISEKVGESALGHLMAPFGENRGLFAAGRRFLSNPPTDPRTEVIASLVDRQISKELPVVFLVDSDLLVETLVSTDRSNAIPLSNPDQEFLLLELLDLRREQLRGTPCGIYFLIQEGIYGGQSSQVMSDLRELVVSEKDPLLVDQAPPFSLYLSEC